MEKMKVSRMLWCLCLWVFGGGNTVEVVRAATDSTSTTRQLDQTPTWAVAAVCSVIILISIILEKGLHKIGTWLTERHKKALFEALEKVKSELMILGFISLLLTFGQSYIAKICIPTKVADSMLPCAFDVAKVEGGSGWRLLSFDRRFLASSTTTNCKTLLEAVGGYVTVHMKPWVAMKLVYFVCLCMGC